VLYLKNGTMDNDEKVNHCINTPWTKTFRSHELLSAFQDEIRCMELDIASLKLSSYEVDLTGKVIRQHVDDVQGWKSPGRLGGILTL
jgi:hypothetical protein